MNTRTSDQLACFSVAVLLTLTLRASGQSTLNPCTEPLPNCISDVFPPGGNGIVDVDDLIQGVIATWGQSQNPPGTGPRPLGDCAPLPNGDCLVDVDDILAVISGWGLCPPITGACCSGAVCLVTTQLNCTSAPHFGTYHGDFVQCSQVPCDSIKNNNLCANAMPIANGTTTFSTVFATTDGTDNWPLPNGVDCEDGAGTQTVHDIWYRYTATCSGILTVSTCPQLGGASNYDTDLVLYPGNVSCPPASTQIIACNDDDPNNLCGQSPSFQSTLVAGVVTGQSYLLRVGGWGTSANRGTGVLAVTCVDASCGNGIVEPGEHCDDNNNVPFDGCTNCTVDADCSAACTFTEPEPCTEGPDTVNGGCNTTPALFTHIELDRGAAVVCGTSSASQPPANGSRDIDWYTVTVGPSGQVQTHITATSPLPMWTAVATSSQPLDPRLPCPALLFSVSPVAIQGQCQTAVRTGMLPGSTAILVAVPNVFTGFPCTGGPWTYKLRIVSP